MSSSPDPGGSALPAPQAGRPLRPQAGERAAGLQPGASSGGLLLLLLLLLLAFPGTDYSCEKTFVVVRGVVAVVVEIKGISVDQEPVLKVWTWRKGSGSK